jgi:hypothetical protein
MGTFVKLQLLFIVLIMFNGCFVNFISNGKSQEEVTKITEERIQKDSKLRELDDLCKTIPIPVGYGLIAKNYGKNSTFIDHHYALSDEGKYGYEFIKDFYINALNIKGWILIGNDDFGSKYLEFKKEGKFLMISVTPDLSRNWEKQFGLTCSDTAYSR